MNRADLLPRHLVVVVVALVQVSQQLPGGLDAFSDGLEGGDSLACVCLDSGDSDAHGCVDLGDSLIGCELLDLQSHLGRSFLGFLRRLFLLFQGVGVLLRGLGALLDGVPVAAGLLPKGLQGCGVLADGQLPGLLRRVESNDGLLDGLHAIWAVLYIVERDEEAREELRACDCWVVGQLQEGRQDGLKRFFKLRLVEAESFQDCIQLFG